MDRLFLDGLVRELATALEGSRVRSVRHDLQGRVVSLALSRPRERELVFHLGGNASGLMLRETTVGSGKPSSREAQLGKLLTSSAIVSVETAELDRIVTVTLEHTRLSGKRRRLAFVLELIPPRSTLYLIDLHSSNVIESWPWGPARAAAGDRYRPIAPPPHASPPATDVNQFSERLESAGNVIDRDALLSATGWTPLLVKELSHRIRNEGKTPEAAFEELSSALRARRPVLYVKRPKVVLSPIALTSETELSATPMDSFNAAMVEAVGLASEWEREDALRRKLAASLSRRLKTLRALAGKLHDQQVNLPDPEELRKRGETLLAGIGRARRVSDARVVVPDPFHPEERSIEIAIDPRLGLPENAERMFRRSRKAERTEVELRRRLNETEQQIEYLEGMRVSLDDASGTDELETLAREAAEQRLLPQPASRPAKERRDQRLPPRSYRSRRGNRILVGRSARSNEEVTFRLATPDDLWFHASGVPGSHVVLKLSRTPEGDDDEIREAAGYAAHFSKARNDTYVDVMFTERRHVRKIKGAPPGLVRVDHVRTVRVRPTPPPDDE